MYEKRYVSLRPPPKISYKDYWMYDLDSEVAGSRKENQRIQPKPKTQLSRTVRPVCGQESTKEIEKLTMFDREDVTDSTSTGSPVCGLESTKRCVLTTTHIEEDQTRTVRPVLVVEHDIDFRVPGLSHAVVKGAEHLRVQLVKKIENHPHREALHADLQQNNVYNPLSNNSKAMIRELGNVELFELCETIPKGQCSHCLLYWNQGIVYCTCGQSLIDSESKGKFNKLTGCTLYPELRDQARALSWSSTRQNRRTERVPSGLVCVEEMLQES